MLHGSLVFQQGFAFVEYLIEPSAEEGKGGGGGDKIGNRFCQEHCKDLICEEVRQNINEWNEQNDFPQQGQEQRNFCLAYGDKGLLTGQLNTHHETGGQIDPKSPGSHSF